MYFFNLGQLNSSSYKSIALCFTLTLGAFAYRPPEAKAVAGVDDAVVIGALLSAFAGGCGLIFSNNGMTSGEIADGMAAKWNEFNASAQGGAETFAGWLGYEDTDALIQALAFEDGKLFIPRTVARKLADFTEWFVNDLGLSSDSGSKPFCFTAGGTKLKLLNGSSITLGVWADSENVRAVTPGSVLFYVTEDMYSQAGSLSWDFTFLNGQTLRLDLVLAGGKPVLNGELLDSSGVRIGINDLGPSNGLRYLFSYGEQQVYAVSLVSDVNGNIRLAYYGHFFANQGDNYIWVTDNAGVYSAFCRGLTVSGLNAVFSPDASADVSVGTTVNAGDFSHLSGKFGDAAKDDTASLPSLSGVGDGTATTVEELLQQILAQLQANTLSPSLDVDGTQTGGETGTDTDEDAKPYLPFIPRIFEKLGELPAAIAEKVGALFTPDEALITEITDTFKGKFGFLSNLNAFVNDLFSLTPETEPPVIWVHLENAESKYGYVYGDKQKILDLAWYQKYKGSVDGILSGFLWLGYLWLLFKRAPGILNGMALADDDAPRSADIPDTLNAPPRLNAGDGSTMFRGDGFTMRDKGARGK